jgi:hypothetical protein
MLWRFRCLRLSGTVARRPNKWCTANVVRPESVDPTQPTGTGFCGDDGFDAGTGAVLLADTPSAFVG